MSYLAFIRFLRYTQREYLKLGYIVLAIAKWWLNIFNLVEKIKKSAKKTINLQFSSVSKWYVGRFQEKG